MQNFDYQSPTRLVFGEGIIEKLPRVMNSLGKKILLTYGGGSIKKIPALRNQPSAGSLYDYVHTLLQDFEIIELSGIQPNPKYNPSVLEGVRLCKEHKVDVILSVGLGAGDNTTAVVLATRSCKGDDVHHRQC